MTAITKPIAKSISWRPLALAGLLLLSGASAAAATACSQCGRTLAGRHLVSGEQRYCSQACYQRTLPSCATCGTRLAGRHLLLDERHFCGTPCMEQTMPKCEMCQAPLYRRVTIGEHAFCDTCAKRPPCWKCQLPIATGRKLDDGRQICADCFVGLIFSDRQAKQPYFLARHELFRVTSFKSPTIPTLHLVGQQQLRQWGSDDAQVMMVQRGLYKREATVTTITGPFGKSRRETSNLKKNIYILTGLTEAEFIVTAVHELTHDLLAEQHPQLVGKLPGWLQEGICQYTAAAVCLLNGYYDQLKAIENAPDREYGDGYRYLRDKFGDARWRQLDAWLNTLDPATLPDYPPRTAPQAQPLGHP